MNSRKLITHLADYLRGSFSFSNIQKGVPFSSELALIESYVEIEKARFKDRIRIEYEISESIKGVMLPPLLIQPLVENAIRHVIGSRLEGGVVRIKACKDRGLYGFEVEDNGVGIEQEKLKQLLTHDPGAEPTSRSGVGLQNIGNRLKYMYGTELSIESTVGVGTKVTVSVPIQAM